MRWSLIGAAVGIARGGKVGTGESGAAEESDEGVGLGGGVGAGLGGGVGAGLGVGEGAGVRGVGDVSGGVSVWLGLAMVGVNGGGDKLCSAGRVRWEEHVGRKGKGQSRREGGRGKWWRV